MWRIEEVDFKILFQFNDKDIVLEGRHDLPFPSIRIHGYPNYFLIT